MRSGCRSSRRFTGTAQVNYQAKALWTDVLGSTYHGFTEDYTLVNANFGQFIVNTKSNEDREIVRARLLKLFDEEFPELRGRVNRLENGPPVGYPVQFRVVGEDKARIRAIANEVAA